jgi:hypothetical protein
MRALALRMIPALTAISGFARSLGGPLYSGRPGRCHILRLPPVRASLLQFSVRLIRRAEQGPLPDNQVIIRRRIVERSGIERPVSGLRPDVTGNLQAIYRKRASCPHPEFERAGHGWWARFALPARRTNLQGASPRRHACLTQKRPLGFPPGAIPTVHFLLRDNEPHPRLPVSRHGSSARLWQGVSGPAPTQTIMRGDGYCV